MSDLYDAGSLVSPEMLSHYETGIEAERLSKGTGLLEIARTQELIERYLPSTPAVILDVGGGAGVYSLWLASKGFEVHLIDAVSLHVEQAREASRRRPDHPIASVSIGDARKLDRADSSVDLVLLLGPLYHLVDERDRVSALGEARRVLRNDGVVVAAAISRFASILDGLARGYLDDPEFARIIEQDLSDGQHRNPSNHPAYFTTAFFHHPEELKREMEEAGLFYEATLAIEGPCWLLQNFEDHWRDDGRRERLMNAIRAIEAEPSLLGVSAHMLAIARKR